MTTEVVNCARAGEGLYALIPNSNPYPNPKP